jgi:putative hydrolase of the HAD superfamily
MHRLKLPVDPAKAQEAHEIRREFACTYFNPRDDAFATIKLLKESGLKLGLISDCTFEIPKLWKTLPFADYFDATVFSCEAGVKKPSPIVYSTACERLGVEGGDCIYVGDGFSNELAGASEAGMRAVLLYIPGEEVPDPRAREVDWEGDRVDSLSRVSDLLIG